MFDDLLLKLGLKYEDLNQAERETYSNWLKTIEKNTLSLDSIRSYIEQMKEAVEMELEKTDNAKELDLMLKARLKNYRLLLAFLQSPEKAKKALDSMLTGLANKGGEVK